MKLTSDNSISIRTLKQVVEKTINAVVITDRQGLTTWVNRGFERITGFQFNEVIGKKPGDVLQGSESDPQVVRKMRSAIANAEPFEVTILNYTKQGARYWNYIECMPLFEADEHTGFLAIQTDVTATIEYQNQLVKANKRAQENSERLLLAFAGGQVGSWDWNTIGDELYFHESWEHLVGAKPGTLKHKLETWEKRIHPDDIDNFKQQLASITREKQDQFISEHRLLCDQNHYRWTMARGQVVDRDAAGNPTRMVGVHLDISEQKRTQQLLDERNDLLQTILDVIPFAVSWKDTNSCYIGCNDLFLDFWGFSHRSDVISKTDRELFLSDYDAEIVMAEDRAVIESGKPLMHKIEYCIRKNGDQMTLDTSKVPLRLYNDSTGLLVISIDVTELEMARESLRENEVNLRHAGRMQAVGELAGGIAHEFNNLLQAIGGFVTFARDEISTHTQAYSDLTQCMTAVKRAVQLTDQLLRFSRVEEVQKIKCNSLIIIEDLRVLLRPLLPENIKLEFELDSTLPPIHANPLLLGQALLNLCMNSRDAMPHGGTLTIGNRLITTEQEAWMGCYVKDTGFGILEYIQDRIFDPFFTTKEVGEGTGLGLSMVYSTAQEHEGRVEFESQPGKGSRFEILIPVIKETDSLTRHPQMDLAEVKAKMSNMSHVKSILIAEDDSIVMLVTLRMLETLGYQVLSAKNGWDAVEIYREEKDRIDCLLFDVSMPLMNGPDAYEEISRQGDPPPVVFCTGYDANHKLKTTLSQQGFHLIYKPFDQAALEEAIAGAINSNSSR
ncbi:PAS domain S-box protein [Gimesia sp.]|uniref:PAS domain-containing hybrid sensor histidine kinase/response regulator n=1 Tax=Gimesia sp. TaxID=2024833 RepID=UPI003A93F32C